MADSLTGALAFSRTFGRMPEMIDDYYARVMAAADDQGRLGIPADGIPNWEIFPFDSEGLRLKPIEPLADAEEPRHGEDPTQCECAQTQPDDEWAVWADDRWQVRLFEESGAPLIVMLSPRAHHDFTAMPMDLAAEMGQIMVMLGAVIQALVRAYGGRAIGRAG